MPSQPIGRKGVVGGIPGGLVASSDGPHILVVEDEPLIRMGLADTCERAGFLVAEAQDGVEALSVLKLHPSIALVVTDIDMPRMDGLELTRTLRDDFPSVRVVLMSGKTYLRTSDFPSEIPFFEKPVDDGALLACLKTLSAIAAND
jgi:two-component system, response regulator PdtaR